MDENKNQIDEATAKSSVNCPVSVPLTLDGEILDDVIMEYYTILHTYDGFCWYASGILTTSQTEALKQFGGYTGVKDYRLIRVKLPTLIKKVEAH